MSGEEMSHKSRRKISPPDAAAMVPARPRVVLIADDDPDWRMLVRDALADEAAAGGLQLHEATDGQSALQFLIQEGAHSQSPQVELLYLDCDMPRMDGLTVLQRMRQSPRLRNVPVVMLTGISDEASMRRAFDLGASGWIVKPSSLPDLKRALIASARHLLDMGRPQKQRRRPSPKRAA